MAVNPPDHFPNNPEASMYSDEGTIFSQLTLEELVSLKPKEIRQKTGEKITLQERIGLKILKAKYRKAQKQKGSQDFGDDRTGIDTLSLFSLIFSLFSLFTLPIIPALWFLFAPLGLIIGIIAVASPKRFLRKKGKGFAIAGIVIAGIQLLLLLLFILSPPIDLGG